MIQPTTIRTQRIPTLTLRAPGATPDLRRLGAIVIHVATAAIVAASMATAVATAGDRITGNPTRLTEPAAIVRPVSTPAPAPEIAPTPRPGF